MRWSREAPFAHGAECEETWTAREASGRECRFAVSVRLGKPLDVLALKADVVEDFERHLAKIRASRERMFGGGSGDVVARCPVCEASASDSRPVLEVYGARYHACGACDHRFVVRRPGAEQLRAFYASDESYSETYRNPRTATTRATDVAAPKARWVLDHFLRLHGRRPRHVLDVGAGSGHFVRACRDLGLAADGIEVSESSRKFASEQLGVQLAAGDFVADRFRETEVVSFWGVIEHVAEPLALLRTARTILSMTAGGLVVAEVPRWDSLSTAVQSVFSDSVVRHLDPGGHIHCFTESSLATAFVTTGFRPAAAWYFGMDAYEAMMQIVSRAGDTRRGVASRLGDVLSPLQAAVDMNRFSDSLVLAGMPHDRDEAAR